MARSNYVWACYYFFMEKSDKICSCGKVHENQTEFVFVGENADLRLVDFVKKKSFENVILFSDDKKKSEELSVLFEKNQIKTQVMLISFCKPFEFFARKLESKDADVLVAVGSEELVSVAKYFSFSNQIDLIVFPEGNFTDWTFSSFARLHDGVQFCFYRTSSPLAIFVEEEKRPNNFQTYYVSSKFLVLFDKEFERLVFKKDNCENMQNFFKKTLKNYLTIDASLSSKNVWTLIRLGMAMSFFGETKYFFGGDKLVCDILQSICLGDFLELETIALKLAINSYATFLSCSRNQGVANLNFQIKKISELLKIPATEVIKRLGDNSILMPQKEIWMRFCSFQPYLKKHFDKMASKMFKIQTSFFLDENIVKKNNLNGEKILHAFGVSASFGKVPTLLGLIEACGYLDKLFE